MPEKKLLGLGISTPGPVDVYSGRILTPPNFDMWSNVGIVEVLKKGLPYDDILLENNSTAHTLAEKITAWAKNTTILYWSQLKTA